MKLETSGVQLGMSFFYGLFDWSMAPCGSLLPVYNIQQVVYHKKFLITTTLIDSKSAAENGYLRRWFKLPFYQNLSHPDITCA
ncbi:hypothetical protein VN97_g1064 [Penicillium thymicola]|uniref:Uncharacterized protein n=1 Tax=Penicillium thymicola TaxID=293382 RepID=A0AAI9TRQ4_PENTH|nr:hypothetical protein VN97_g1064 [Penicillium thymicola]